MPSKPRIALLGGGQLGRMFIENALRYDIRVDVLDPDPQCPCAKLAQRFVQGAFNDRETVLRFAAQADVVGIEIEHVSVEALAELEQKGKRVIPAPHVLRTIQDKGLQKAFYQQHGIPSAPFALIDKVDDIARHPGLLPAFLKLTRGGYDGKGVLAINRAEDVPAEYPGPYVLEKRIDMVKELAVIALRSAEGALTAYDPVEMVFDPELNLVDVLLAPARIEPALSAKAKDLAMEVAKAFGAPGIYAVEMFLTRAGELLVNETAPRAHNSGHFTIEACESSQFDQLLRAYMGWPLGGVRMHGKAAMVNLIGHGAKGVPHLVGAHGILGQPGAFIHLYGKAETRDGRKMGHITVVAPQQEEVDRLVHQVRKHAKVEADPMHMVENQEGS